MRKILHFHHHILQWMGYNTYNEEQPSRLVHVCIHHLLPNQGPAQMPHTPKSAQKRPCKHAKSLDTLTKS
ncbi:hypothetical protein K505DRAFT_28671 [Melanomma pulvis-pyrius CBS 109.77]|uniref:Uncharacterized protein n=1 Tax=Melanomma pulvis-pyrius CBS 109.77 TaxID=1314802 RepID=A0A6A6XDX3_9PLEO|nr:hypothetical protein K505DRAFT_28671 [Melanomma pulvis-pyrius CBS 109.77]